MLSLIQLFRHFWDLHFTVITVIVFSQFLSVYVAEIVKDTFLRLLDSLVKL